MSHQPIIQDLKQSGSQKTVTNIIPSMSFPRLCIQQSELLLHHDAALQEVFVAIRNAFQQPEHVAAGKEEETHEKEALPRCILSYAWPSDTYQEKETPEHVSAIYYRHFYLDYKKN